MYVGYFSSCCKKIPDSKQLVLAYSLRGYSASLEERHGSGSRKLLVIASILRKQRVNMMEDSVTKPQGPLPRPPPLSDPLLPAGVQLLKVSTVFQNSATIRAPSVES